MSGFCVRGLRILAVPPQPVARRDNSRNGIHCSLPRGTFFKTETMSLRIFLILGMLLGVVASNILYAADDPLAGNNPYRRLFLDAMVVEESQGLTRIFHSAEKYKGNPVVPKDKPWEGWGPYQYGTVLWDEGKLKMWYSCIGTDSGYTCYAESQDGIKWTKPNLGVIDFKGSAANNIAGTMGLPSVMKLSDNRWAMYSWGGKKGPWVAFSEDGLRWTEGKTELFKSSDVVNFFYDPYREQYVSTYKTPNRRHRAVGIALSKDGIEWSKPVEGAVVGADDLDPDASQFYGMPVFPYQGMYIGLPWIYHARWMKYGIYDSPSKMHEAQEGSPCTVDVQMAWSWNLIQWTRTPERKPFIALGPEGSWDDGMIYTARAPVIVGDKLYFYYGGFDKIHDEYKDVHGAIGLATLRLDGFCSMHTDGKEGWLISRREVFRTPRITINAVTGKDGYVTAELLDRNDNIIPGFSRNDCIPFKGDSIRYLMRWKTAEFPKKLVDADKKIRFFLKNADLYSYLPSDIDMAKDDGKVWTVR